MTEQALGLQPAEAGLLAHVLVGRALQSAEVDAVIIKGPTLASRGLRAERLSHDVDVLVRPRQVSTALQVMQDLGWELEAPAGSRRRSISGHVGATLGHRLWPLQIDVHESFPGFCFDNDVVFDELWHRREAVVIAGVEVVSVDRPTSAAIGALHALRDIAVQGPAYSDLVSHARHVMSAEELEQLSTLARVTGAQLPLAPFLRDLGLPVHLTGEDHEISRAWRVRQAVGGRRSATWVYALLDAPPRSWLSIVGEALAVTPADVRTPDGSESPRGLRLGQLRRIGRGLLALPMAVWAVARAMKRRR
ncbi:nucleotidyltransferase family protein [Nocardioides sp. HDW12B]|nr:nucleotidyltransferase family protein [Nocardioides sp. HDW12B]